jgi:Immunoglobulin-like domain of bacterial spore germination
MRARRTRPLRLLAAGACAVLAGVTLAGCASGTVQAGASTATSAATPSATPLATTRAPEPTATSTPADVVPTDQPTNGPNTLTAPAPGATVDGPDVTVTGTGTAFEATLNWEAVPAGGGDPVAQGFTTAGANGEIGPFTFTATLPKGPVTLSVWEPDMSDGAAGTQRHNLVSVTFTVR